MIRPKLLLCAEGIVVDKKTNNVTVYSLLEETNFRSLPVVLPKMVIMSLLERDEGDPEEWSGGIRITLAGSEIFNRPVTHRFQGQKRTRNMLTIGGMPIAQPGILEIALYIGSESVMSYTIEVRVPEQPTVET